MVERKGIMPKPGYVEKNKKLALAWEAAEIAAKQAEADLEQMRKTTSELREKADRLNKERDTLFCPIAEKPHKALFPREPVVPDKKMKQDARIDRSIRDL